MQSITNPKKVLLVDDDRQQFLLIGYLLSEAHYDDYRLIWCQDLEKGLSHIEHHQCDVVLLDYHWGINCKDFIQRAHSLNSSIPVIVMTDDMEREVDRKAISEGASDYLVKETLNPEIIERTIRYSIERKKIEQRLDYLAHYDYLTGLPNRALFSDRLHQTVSLAHRSDNQFTLMYIDLNDFKGVNDNYGHDIGDGLLKEFANRLQASVRRSDTVARIGGDEFTIVLNNMGSTPKIIFLAQTIIANVQMPFFIGGHQLSVGCSIGIAVFPDAGEDVELLQRNADTAMYQAKQESQSCYRFFCHPKKETLALENLSPDEFVSQVKENKFSIAYTPRIDIKTNRIVAIAINPIWHHSGLGDQHYDNFGGLIASNETLALLTEWLLEESLRDIQNIYPQGDLLLSYSIRSSQLKSPRFGEYVKKVIHKYNVDIENIEFNFLSKKACGQDVFLKECIENVNNIGARFSLHEFGENTLSLVNVHRYNISSLHFAPSFLQLALENKEDALLLESLIILAHRLDKKVVANSISTNTHIKLMQAIDCDYAQGGIVGENFSTDQIKYMLEKTNALLIASEG